MVMADDRPSNPPESRQPTSFMNYRAETGISFSC